MAGGMKENMKPFNDSGEVETQRRVQSNAENLWSNQSKNEKITVKLEGALEEIQGNVTVQEIEVSQVR